MASQNKFSVTTAMQALQTATPKEFATAKTIQSNIFASPLFEALPLVLDIFSTREHAIGHVTNYQHDAIKDNETEEIFGQETSCAIKNMLHHLLEKAIGTTGLYVLFFSIFVLLIFAFIFPFPSCQHIPLISFICPPIIAFYQYMKML